MPAWPPGRSRTRHPERARFDHTLTIEAAQRDLMAELRRINARDLVIDTDLRRRNDGGFYSNQRQPEDQGVVVYFTLPSGRKVCMPCDRWDRIQHNIRAVARTLEAKRAIERWGTATQDAEYEGYAALPATVPARRPPHEVLGIAPDAPREVVEAARRALLLKHHPDRGGDPAAFHEVTEAADALLGGPT